MNPVEAETQNGGGPRTSWATHWPATVLLALGLAVGVWLGNDYGVSWDEVRNAEVGRDALAIFSGSREYFSNESLADHGPVYFSLFSATSKIIVQAIRGWTEADGRHLTNFLTFLVGVACFYSICRRVLRNPFDWMTTALFATQPLFFGYAFINQKDIPFLTAFLATLATGLAAVDAWVVPSKRVADSSSSPTYFASALTSEWQRLNGVQKAFLVALAVLSMGLIADFVFFGSLHRFGESLVESAYNHSAPGPVQALFDRLAVDAYKTPFDAYAAKYQTLFDNVSAAGLVALPLTVLVSFSLALPTLRRAWGFSGKLAGSLAWITSGVLLGLTVCIRQVGAFVGVLVTLAAFRRGRTQALFPVTLYWLIAALATLATWPYLWGDPVHRIFESLQLAASFSPHVTLFWGKRVASGELPWDFFPTLTALQLTETAVVLIVAGLLMAIVRLMRRDRQRFLIAILLLWFGVPLFLLIAFHTAGYEFRHFLFMLPPLLILAGLALQEVGGRLHADWATGLLFSLAILPGLIGILQLHPYEYIYFNSFVGGVGGANGKFQIDRECLSYREAIEVVNGFAAPGATIVVPQQTNQVTPFARSDLIVRDATFGIDRADIVLSCIWRDSGDWRTGGFSRVYEVRRDSVVLTDVWKRSEGP